MYPSTTAAAQNLPLNTLTISSSLLKTFGFPKVLDIANVVCAAMTSMSAPPWPKGYLCSLQLVENGKWKMDRRSSNEKRNDTYSPFWKGVTSPSPPNANADVLDGRRTCLKLMS